MIDLRPDSGPKRQSEDPRVRRVELLISHTLRAGVVISLVTILLGMAISFVRHPDYLTSAPALARLTRPGAAFPHGLGGVITGLSEWRGQAIVALGLLLMIATPVVRVAISIFAFIYQRDTLFVIITSTVLTLLILSFVLGHAGG